MKYKNIVNDLLKFGVDGIEKWDKEEFVIVCMDDYEVCRATAEKVFAEYHRIVDNI